MTALTVTVLAQILISVHNWLEWHIFQILVLFIYDISSSSFWFIFLYSLWILTLLHIVEFLLHKFIGTRHLKRNVDLSFSDIRQSWKEILNFSLIDTGHLKITVEFSPYCYLVTKKFNLSYFKLSIYFTFYFFFI